MERKLKAFTLAEVLITLGIIGVVAALTIPTLMQKFDERETVTKMKKMYSTLTTAYQNYFADNGVPEPQANNSDGATYVFNIFKPYLKIAQDCGVTNTGGCLANVTYKTKDGNNYYNYSTGSAHYKALLADGSALIFKSNSGSDVYFEVFYDINGPKGPNQWGYDLFAFSCYDDGKCFPADRPTNEQPLGYWFDHNCASSNAAGAGCAVWVIYKENLDYLKCDDLSWNGKQKCD
ncbi:type II secretion system protein [bacterium]|nr:type II secretion system protein [bacterium]